MDALVESGSITQTDKEEHPMANAMPAEDKPAKRGKPGRPEGTAGNVRETMLDAAEMTFADLGYAGTTLREISQKANVTQALISYYFGSKFGLFKEVFLRRSRKISDARLDNLAVLLREPQAPTVRAIVLAFLKPTLALRATPEGQAFIRLQARVHTEPPEISYQLRNEAYDVSTRAYVDALRAVLPSLSEKDVYWRVTLMIGAYLYAFSNTHRLEQLAGDVCDPDNTDEVLDQVATFVTGGLEAAATLASGPAR